MQYATCRGALNDPKLELSLTTTLSFNSLHLEVGFAQLFEDRKADLEGPAMDRYYVILCTMKF